MDPIEDQNRALSPLGIIVDSDSEDEEDMSVASTPVHSKTPKAEPTMRKTVSSSALESLERPSIEILSTKKSFPGTTQLSAMKTDDEDRWSFSSKDDDNSSLGLAFGPEPLPVVSRHGSSSYAESSLPPIYPSTPEKTDGGRLINSIWSLSPIAKVIKDTWDSTPSRSSKRRPSIPKKVDTANLRRKSSSEVADQSEDELITRNSSLSNNDSIANDTQVRHEFEAPRKGQLGLVIESNRKTGPIVHAIKDYSPLFGLVKQGDKIVEVDGKKTSTSTLSEITKLLQVRPRRTSSNLRIVVTRSKQSANPSIPHSRENSFEGSSIASSRILEEADIPAGENETISDDMMKGSFYSDVSTEQAEL